MRELSNVHNLLDGVLRMVAPQLGAGVAVDRRYGELPMLACGPPELQQVFLNLVLNANQAIDAIGDGGTIHVRTGVDRDSICVWIDDDGCGIDPELVDRVFDPFFTTKRVGEGTGLGLGISHEIVRKHGGEIVVASTPGAGTSVCVRLPIAADTLEGN